MAGHLRWGILGTANIALAKVIPAIQRSSNGTVVALASRDEDRGRTAATKLGIDRAYSSYDALLDDPEVDAIYNPLPNALHAQWTIRAAEAGKAILCEKPLARNAAEARHMVEACASRGVPLMEAFMYRHHPQHARVRELVTAGAIGTVNEVRAGLCVRLMDPLEPTNVRLQRDLGGGALLDMGCYGVNTARLAFGEEPLRALAWRDFDDRFGVDVALAGIIEAPRAFIPGWDQLANDAIVTIYDRNNNRREESFAPVDHYQLMVESFASAVLRGEPVPYPPTDAVCNMRALDALADAANRDSAVAVE